MSAEKPAISVAVLAILKERWQPPNGYTAHRDVFERYPKRQRDPSWYVYRADEPDKRSDSGVFSFSEIVRLRDAGVIDGLIREGDGFVSVNEHIQHALADFMRETYEAWERFEERRKAIRAAR